MINKTNLILFLDSSLYRILKIS